jgi:hypothetical protein
LVKPLYLGKTFTFLTKPFYFLAKPPPFGKTNILSWFNFYFLTICFSIFWLNHHLFGIVHTLKNLKDIVEGDDYHQ